MLYSATDEVKSTVLVFALPLRNRLRALLNNLNMLWIRHHPPRHSRSTETPSRANVRPAFVIEVSVAEG